MDLYLQSFPEFWLLAPDFFWEILPNEKAPHPAAQNENENENEKVIIYDKK